MINKYLRHQSAPSMTVTPCTLSLVSTTMPFSPECRKCPEVGFCQPGSGVLPLPALPVWQILSAMAKKTRVTYRNKNLYHLNCFPHRQRYVSLPFPFSICVYVCVHTCVCVYTCMCVHTCVHVCTGGAACMCIHVRVYACAYTCMHKTYVWVDLHAYMCMCVYVLYACACVCIHVHVYTRVEVGDSNSAFLLNSLRQSLSQI